MSSETDLPDDVIAELAAGRKIDAIKLLRVRQGIDLKEAKGLVEAYLRQHPPDKDLQIPDTDSGIGRIVLLIIGVGVIYGIYKLLA